MEKALFSARKRLLQARINAIIIKTTVEFLLE
jgi:hypothetical protein